MFEPSKMGELSKLRYCMGSPLKREFANDHTPRFQPRQIVCLEHEAVCLYAEVVQAIESRQMCWVRPLILTVSTVQAAGHRDDSGSATVHYDLREDSDLLWPLALFRAALDTEVLPLLGRFYGDGQAHQALGDRQIGRQQFRQFVRQVWEARSEHF